MRDALSLLDQCIAFYLGQELTYDKVLDTLGAVDTEIFSRLLRQILDKNITGAIQTVETLVIEGRELGQFVTDFTWYLRNLMLVQSSDDMEDVLDISTENLALLKEEAQMVDTDILMRYIRIFSELSNQIRYAVQKRILIEIAVIKLCKPEMEKDYGSLIDRVDMIGGYPSTVFLTVPLDKVRFIFAANAESMARPLNILFRDATDVEWMQ